MSSEIEIKYRNGLPTRKTIDALTKEFFGENHYMIYEGYGYGKQQENFLIWSRKAVQEKMEEFIKFLNEKGIPTGEYRPYNSPSNGHLEILRRN